MPQGLLYHYFESKEVLFQEVLNDAMRPYFEATVELLQAWKPEGVLLAEAVRVYFDFLTENPHVARLFAWWFASQGWLKGQDLVKELQCENPTELGVQRLREGQEAGLIRPELDPHAVIGTFIDLCLQWHISVGWSMAQAGLDPTDESTVSAMHRHQREHIVDFIMRATLTPEALTRWLATPSEALEGPGMEHWTNVRAQTPLRCADNDE